MVICVDCDNILCNLQETIVNKFNERYGTNYTLEAFSKFNISECIPKENAINMVAMYSESGIYDTVTPLEHAQKSIQKLIRSGHEVYVVTDSDPSIFEEKSNWIKFHFPEIDDAHIVCMKHKWLFRCDVMIDDNIDNLLNGYHYDRITIDYPWNQARDEIYDIHRASNWNGVMDFVNKINKMWSDVV